MNKKYCCALCISLALWLCTGFNIYGQSTQKLLNTVALTSTSAFNHPAKNWQIVGDVHMDMEKPNDIKTDKGTGILVNVINAKKQGEDLIFNLQHGDIDLEMDYMMARSSNSGIYLQGRYEVQLLDSWGVTVPTAGDNGGIYERWDEQKPVGRQGFEGHSPRQNVSRAPGLWQHIKISFRAPRFDAAGKKTENAKILLIELNGIRVQEDVELSGPTRGALDSREVATGPLRLQGDHGVVAFRNISYSTYDKQRPELLNLKYAVYKGHFDNEPDYANLPPEAKGTSATLSSGFSPLQNEFLMHYTGEMKVNEPGEYTFNLSVPGGSGLMRIGNNKVVPLADWKSSGKVTLQAGIIPFDLYYSKTVDWAKPALGLSVSGPGIRECLISDANVTSNDAVDPILINPATDNMLLRCFIDLDNGQRVTHAINIGSNKQVHYTYDADNGMMVQLWRGGFLDATPMWHERGDGSSKATGAVLQFGAAVPAIEKLSSTSAAWATDTAGSGFKLKGYSLMKDKRPIFRYTTYGTNVSDATIVLDKGRGIQRKVELQDDREGLYFRIALVNNIEDRGDGWYLINDKTCYLHIEDADGKPVIRDASGKKEVLVPIRKKITYSVLF